MSKHAKWATPLGDLNIDRDTVEKLKETGKFDLMSSDADETEHSMEMHIPYIYKRLSQTFDSPDKFPPLIPILVGNTKTSAERVYAEILAPYLADPESVFVVSSDFCHWGLRFQYTYYVPDEDAPRSGYELKRRDKDPKHPLICKSIGRLDRSAMDAIETGNHETFLENLNDTGNTVCGRHPIGVVMAAIEILKKEGKISGDCKGKFKFVRYERSSEVEEISDSSVSYASAYAVL